MISRTVKSSPPYPAKLNGAWRIVVPIRGKLAPRLVETVFSSRSAAIDWLKTDLGQELVERIRSRMSI